MCIWLLFLWHIENEGSTWGEGKTGTLTLTLSGPHYVPGMLYALINLMHTILKKTTGTEKMNNSL